MSPSDPRQQLWQDLLDYEALPHAHQCALTQIKDFVAGDEHCFERDNERGHITASALLLHPQGDRCLVLFHRKLQRWLQPGGHVESSDSYSTLQAAIREAEEESGLRGIRPVSSDIFDLDVHAIPARPEIGAHHHFDIRYLLIAPHEQGYISDESEAIAWMSLNDIEERVDLFDEAFLRMTRLWKAKAEAYLTWQPTTSAM